MEIINKDHDEVKIAGAREVPHISFHMDGGIAFSADTCIQMRLPYTGYLHFVIEIDRLYFYIDDKENGYRVKKRHKNEKHRPSIILEKNLAVIAVLKKRLKVVDIGSIFPIKKSTKMNDQTLFEILINKKVKK